LFANSSYTLPMADVEYLLFSGGFLSVIKPDVSGTFPVDRFWGGERARRV
jgi:hypothetical protein